jgi:hypothetical protein
LARKKPESDPRPVASDPRPVASDPPPSVATGETASPGDPGPDFDSGLVSSTVKAVLETCDKIAINHFTTKAREIGAGDAAAREFGEAVKMQDAVKDTMTATAPAVAAALGVKAGHVPIGAFLTAAAVYAASLKTAVDRLAQLAARRTDPAEK